MIRVSTLLNDIFTEANFSFSFVTISMNLDVNYIIHATREGKIMETTFDLAKRVSRVQISIDQRRGSPPKMKPKILPRFFHDFLPFAVNRSLFYTSDILNTSYTFLEGYIFVF